MVSYLERTVDDTESLVTFICSDAEHLPAAGALKLRIAATLYKNVHTTMSDESVSSVIRAFFEIVGFFLCKCVENTLPQQILLRIASVRR